MKNSFMPLLIIGFLLSASFGLVMMNHMDGQGHSQCPLKTAGVIDCAQVQNPLDFITSHLNAVSKFFSAVLTKNFAASLLYLLVLTFAVLIIFDKQLLALIRSFVRSRSKEAFIPPHKILFNHWFALHENSPAFIGRR